jgi:hypothetical protein
MGKECSGDIIQRYQEAINKLNAGLNDSEQKTWRKMLNSPFYLKLIDSGLAISNPQSALRKRIFIMLAILEASPNFTESFLPQERSIFYLIPLGFRAGLSALYLVFGTLTVKLIKVN